ncbi:MAG: hypothetical protein RAO92_05470 [Candidatus Euphemobacter frigidus]|nr:hypothetical protein [Candidatus Euphemobacter frigidus]MDP8275835.1 hypothetical protein [Candidatus Euphemobacter frigidus]
MNYLRNHGEVFLLVIIIITAALWGLSQLFPPLSTPQKIFLLVMLVFWVVSFAYCLFRSEFPFFRKNAKTIGLTLLFAYVIILGLATISEIFEFDWFYWI